MQAPDLIRKLENFVNGKPRSEASDSLFIQSLSEYELETNLDTISKYLKLPKSLIRKLHKNIEPQRLLQGSTIDFDEPEPTREPQDGDKLLQDIELHIRRFIVADDESIVAAALWIVLTHLADTANVLPLLVLSSPVKACGKSQFLHVISRLVARGLPIANISASALFRTIEKFCPTILIDEAEKLLTNNDDILGMVNAGFTRDAAFVLKTVGDDFEPRKFSVWGPKALALIGRIPDTTESRSLIVPMRRKLPNEKVERIRADTLKSISDPLKARIARWARDNAAKIAAIEPDIPDGLTDRQADIWRELLKIADAAGGRWPARARMAAVEICTRSADDPGDIKTQLLQDIQSFFAQNPDEIVSSAALVAYLASLENRPWAEFRHGRELTAATLARLLKPFGIESRTVRHGATTAKGYRKADFIEIFERYLQKPESPILPENEQAHAENNQSEKDNAPYKSLFDKEIETASEEEISTAIQIIGEMAQGGHEQISLTLLHGNLKRRGIGHAFAGAMDYVERFGLATIDRAAGVLRFGGTP